MHVKNVWRLFEDAVFPAPSTDGLFNPYRDRHEAFDLPDAPAIRRANLRSYLGCYAAPPPAFLLAEAPGPWGCRFSGVPLVSEAQLVDDAFPIDGQPSSTREAPHAEYSAGIYWRVLQPYFPQFFTWNSVPYHPHRPGEPLSIRNPSNREVAAYADVLTALLRLLQPRLVLAVGRKAEHALRKAGAEGIYVRHPSQGGARHFEAGVRAAFEAAGLAPR
jgi:uracil-DNA glycosylase